MESDNVVVVEELKGPIQRLDELEAAVKALTQQVTELNAQLHPA